MYPNPRATNTLTSVANLVSCLYHYSCDVYACLCESDRNFMFSSARSAAPSPAASPMSHISLSHFSWSNYARDLISAFISCFAQLLDFFCFMLLGTKVKHSLLRAHFVWAELAAIAAHHLFALLRLTLQQLHQQQQPWQKALVSNFAPVVHSRLVVAPVQ